MAPYSCGGALKFAATSPTDGTVISCQGRCASIAGVRNGKRNIVRKDFIGNLRFGSESLELYCPWTVWRQPLTGDHWLVAAKRRRTRMSEVPVKLPAIQRGDRISTLGAITVRAGSLDP